MRHYVTYDQRLPLTAACCFCLENCQRAHEHTLQRTHAHWTVCKVSSYLHTSDCRKFWKIMVLFSTSKLDKSHNKEDTLLLWVFLQNETVCKISRYNFDWQVSVLNGHFTQMLAFVVVIFLSDLSLWTGYLTAGTSRPVTLLRSTFFKLRCFHHHVFIAIIRFFYNMRGSGTAASVPVCSILQGKSGVCMRVYFCSTLEGQKLYFLQSDCGLFFFSLNEGFLAPCLTCECRPSSRISSRAPHLQVVPELFEFWRLSACCLQEGGSWLCTMAWDTFKAACGLTGNQSTRRDKKKCLASEPWASLN